MDIVFDQEIYFSNKNHLPLNDIAQSLLALQKAVVVAPRAMELLYEDVIADGVEIFIDELRSGSLSENLKYYFRVGLQKHVEDQVGIPIESLENQPPDRIKKIAAWLIAAGMLFALKAASESFQSKEPKTHIDQQINISLNAGRDITGIETNILRNALEKSVRENPEAVKGAVGFVRPAKKDIEASIQLDRSQFLSSQAIAEVPSALPEEELQEKSIEFANTEIYIRATDRDSGKKGWAATIPEFRESRIRLHVAPGIDLNFLAHSDVIVGNVIVFYSIDDRGNVVKPRAHLISLNEQKTKSFGGGSAP